MLLLTTDINHQIVYFLSMTVTDWAGPQQTACQPWSWFFTIFLKSLADFWKWNFKLQLCCTAKNYCAIEISDKIGLSLASFSIWRITLKDLLKVDSCSDKWPMECEKFPRSLKSHTSLCKTLLTEQCKHVLTRREVLVHKRAIGQVHQSVWILN